MEATEKTMITVETTVIAPVEKVWKFFTLPQHIVKWNNANDEWHTPKAENDLIVGGKFNYRMEAKDGSMGFDFNGTYTEVKKYERISYVLEDNREVKITLQSEGKYTIIKEIFEAETSNPIEMQQTGWQAILNNFKKWVEYSNVFQKLKFDIEINAPVDKVYHNMIDEEPYKEWTKVFNKDSHYKGSWEKGSKIIFIGCGENGEMGGMVSMIKENIPGKFISIEHLGLYQDGKEITSGEEVEGWAGALENYTFSEVDGKTLVSVELDSNQEFESYFSDLWPKALQKLKQICES